MRLRIINRLLLSSPALRHQHFHHVSASCKDPTIFESSLERTLEEHRTVNRANLIRKVVPRSNPTALNLEITGKEPTTEPAESAPSRLQNQRLPPSLQRRLKKSKKASRANNSIKHFVDFRPNKRAKPYEWPWLNRLQGNQRFPSRLWQLDAEIRALSNYLTTSPAEQEVIDRILDEVTSIVSQYLKPPEQVHVTRSELAMSSSMLNLIFHCNETDHNAKSNSRYDEFVDRAYKALDGSPFYRVGSTRGHQKLTVIVHIPTSLTFRFLPPQSSSAHIEYIQDFHAEYPTLRPLCLLINIILESHDLQIPADALQVLVAAFLKLNHGRFRHDTSCAEAFVAFTRTFGLPEINLNTTGVSADPPCYFNTFTVAKARRDFGSDAIPAYLRGQKSLLATKLTAKKKNNGQLATALLVQAPGNYNRNLGISFTGTPRLQNVLHSIYKRVEQELRSKKAYMVPEGGLLKTSSVLANCFEVNFKGFEKKRRAILRGDSEEDWQ